MRATPRRVGAVVLTYNSTDDLPDCLAGLRAQRGVDLRVIVVDNASRPKARAQMEADFLTALPEGHILNAEMDLLEEIAAAPAIFMRNNTNGGYSAGNNIGARIAVALGCEAVLIVNPDVRIADVDYVATLCSLITADAKTAVACSAIRNLAGSQENPMTEPSLVEELLWPVTMITAGLLRRRRPSPPLSDAPYRVVKVSGACFLIRADFLTQNGFFDQSVFLYCEESILMAQVRRMGWHMMMEPRVEALHAHQSGAKDDQLSRYRAWSESRRRFHAAHSSHGPVARALLAGSRGVTLGLIQARSSLRRFRGRASTAIDTE